MKVIIKDNDKILWVVFNGGFDIAYLTKLLSKSRLPFTVNEFYWKFSGIFKAVFDLKFAANSLFNNFLDLNNLAEIL